MTEKKKSNIKTNRATEWERRRARENTLNWMAEQIDRFRFCVWIDSFFVAVKWNAFSGLSHSTQFNKL